MKDKTIKVVFKRCAASVAAGPSKAHYKLVKLTNKTFIPLLEPGKTILVGDVVTQSDLDHIVSNGLYEVEINSQSV